LQAPIPGRAPILPNRALRAAERPINVDMSNFMAGSTIDGDKNEAHEIASTVSAMMPTIVNQIRRANFQDSRLYGDYISSIS